VARTTTKGVRFTVEELARIEQLRPQLPEYSSEADLLRHAALLGVLVLAAQATRPGLPPYAGYRADDLAALLKPRLMPALDFLSAQGALPMAFVGQSAGAAPSAVPEASTPTIVEDTAAEDLEGLGTGFMDEE